MFTAQSAAIGPRAHRTVNLGCKDYIVARCHLVEPASGYLFAPASRVDVGGIEEIDPGVQRDRKMLARFFGSERPLAAHGPRRQFAAAITHATETNSRDCDTRVAKLGVLHRSCTHSRRERCCLSRKRNYSAALRHGPVSTATLLACHYLGLPATAATKVSGKRI